MNIQAIVPLALLLSVAGIERSRGAEQGPPSAGTAVLRAVVGSAFTYQGKLTLGGSPVNDTCDGEFRLWDAAVGGNSVGRPQFQILIVSDGLFTTSIDFGSGVFDGNARWLAIAVRCPSGSGSYMLLSPRQQLAATPYALYSAGPWVTNGSAVVYNAGHVGINIPAPSGPGERLHMGDGNILVEGGGETAIKIKRDFEIVGPSGTSRNPIFELGRIIQAGDGDPEFRVIYQDDLAAPRAVFEFDRKGIVASVKRERGSHFEGFVWDTDAQPAFRLNSYPKMRLEMGAGGESTVDVAVQREEADTLTLLTGASERVRVDSSGNVGIGTPNPQSRLQVADGYIHFPVVSGNAPTEADCSSPSHYGRTIVRVDGPTNLYVCTASGWLGK
jgi:hypothetical protein